MMPFLLAEFANREKELPLYVCCIGSHEQKQLQRQGGYPAHQLFLCRRGRGTFRLAGGRSLSMTPGMALLLPAGVPHDYAPSDADDEAWDLGFIAFEGSLAPSLLEQMSRFALTAVKAQNFDTLWEQLAALWHLISLNGEHAYWEASKRLYDILLTLLEGQAPARQEQGGLYPFPQSNAALQAAVKLMHDHYNERLLIANIARAVGYSVQHFHRLFVAGYGMTPQQYLLQLRMRRSVQLMGDHPGIPVEKVAQQLGMETSYFIRMFKRTYGATPKQYVKP
ncbi:AraC family transcriptional regulator [Paenibacillus sacheonensis]|uniref:AraC family transcriptional regulator n=1 Tax=Paenibacillus sacheonensis TaxID=742054 RepID=A0A7X4YQD3_9BACL|nr:AraC family transcriptional regulator [Paenibacillus sacheonensis]NBC70631.1 AraC family transcriptional regulator [Paenibacillus sacheonensis]